MATSAGAVKPAEVIAKVLKSYLAVDKRLLALLAVGTGGVATVAAAQLAGLRTQSKSDRAASAVVLKGRSDSASKRSGPKPPAVDRVFLERLLFVLRIAVPSWRSQEAFMLATQSVVLVSRSLLSLRMARIGGDGLKARAFAHLASQACAGGLRARCGFGARWDARLTPGLRLAAVASALS
jgi:hypothetical protein